jgi:ubiquinone biosynthesis protein UbiJ
VPEVAGDFSGVGGDRTLVRMVGDVLAHRLSRKMGFAREALLATARKSGAPANRTRAISWRTAFPRERTRGFR